jgi:SPP1 family predicted phage head-tail adaptor
VIAGRLRHRIEIQAAAESRTSASGAVSKAWTTTATVWGSVDPLRGKKLEQARQISPRVTHEVMMRGRQSITSANRLLFKGRALNIEYVGDQQERGISTLILATEVPV